MRYYVGITRTNPPASPPGEPSLPPRSCFWVNLDAESPLQARQIAEPILRTVIHPTQQDVLLEMLSRRQWTARIFAYGELPQQRYEVAEIINGTPHRLREVWASSPHEAIEDVHNVLAELPCSAPPRLLQAAVVLPSKRRIAPTTPSRGKTPLEMVLSSDASR